MNNSVITEDWQIIFQHHKHFIGTVDINSQIITEERLTAWAKDPNRKYYCIFCGSEPTIEDNGFIWCKVCGNYKGITPNC